MADTPTPQAMTPEQRAATVYTLRYGNLYDIDPDNLADQLEADGVTIAALTAECDALAAAQTDLKAADAQIELLLKNHNGMSAEITRLRAVIAKDAVQIIEDQHKMHKATKALREVIDFACALNNVAAGQNPEQLDRWSAALSALAAKVDASQAPNPAVNGGSCQSDTITLPRAEVEALMEAAKRGMLQADENQWSERWYFDTCVFLATLQERMK